MVGFRLGRSSGSRVDQIACPFQDLCKEAIINETVERARLFIGFRQGLSRRAADPAARIS